MRKAVTLVLLTELFAVATFAFGWWTVPLIAVIWSIASSESGRARIAAGCAAAGWATLLLLDVARGPVTLMANQLGGVMGLPSAVLFVLTLVFPAVLAWAASTVTTRVWNRSSKGVSESAA